MRLYVALYYCNLMMDHFVVSGIGDRKGFIAMVWIQSPSSKAATREDDFA